MRFKEYLREVAMKTDKSHKKVDMAFVKKITPKLLEIAREQNNGKDTLGVVRIRKRKQLPKSEWEKLLEIVEEITRDIDVYDYKKFLGFKFKRNFIKEIKHPQKKMFFAALNDVFGKSEFGNIRWLGRAGGIDDDTPAEIKNVIYLSTINME